MTDAGMMGLAPSELFSVTEYEFNLLRKGFFKRQETEWEHTRFIVWGSLKAQGANIKIEEVLPLPIDEDRKIEKENAVKSKEVSQEFFDNIMKRLNKK